MRQREGLSIWSPQDRKNSVCSANLTGLRSESSEITHQRTLCVSPGQRTVAAVTNAPSAGSSTQQMLLSHAHHCSVWATVF